LLKARPDQAFAEYEADAAITACGLADMLAAK
jgi:hypothetical protein